MAVTNREKAIADLIEKLKVLDNEALARVIDGITDIHIHCKYCMYDGGSKCYNKHHDSCQNGIKQWLEQE